MEVPRWRGQLLHLQLLAVGLDGKREDCVEVVWGTPEIADNNGLL